MNNISTSVDTRYLIRNLLLKLREYKKANSLSLSKPFIQILQTSLEVDYDIAKILKKIIALDESDEFFEIAIVNFFGRLIECQVPDVIDCALTNQIADLISKKEFANSPVMLEKRLKVNALLFLIRFIFQLPLNCLDSNAIVKYFRLMKFHEFQNLLIRELTKDTLQEISSKFLQILWQSGEHDELLSTFLNEIGMDLEQQMSIVDKEPDQIRILESPLSIIQYALKLYTKAPIYTKYMNKFIQESLIYWLIQVIILQLCQLFFLNQISKYEHMVLQNQILIIVRMIFELLNAEVLTDVQETRILTAQLILTPLRNLIQKMANECLGDYDVSFIIASLVDLFTPEIIYRVYEYTDFDPLQKPILNVLLIEIFELLKFSRKLITEEGLTIQKSTQALIVRFYNASLKCGSDEINVEVEEYRKGKEEALEFLNKFNSNDIGPRKAFKSVKRDISKDQYVALLKTSTSLEQTKMIEILGSHLEEYIALLHQYMASFDFKGTDVCEAVRQFLSNFLMFGEAQMIGRVLESFSNVYFQQNQEITMFENSDSFYLFTYALIMLSTDLYNKNMKDKRMTLEEFYKQCNGINNGKNLPREFLEQVYTNISRDEIKTCRDYAFTDKINKCSLSDFIYFLIFYLPLALWVRYSQKKLQHKHELELSQQIFPGLYIKNPQTRKCIIEEQTSSMIMNEVSRNIEQMILQYQNGENLNELTSFLYEILQVCIQNNKMSNARRILSEIYKIGFDNKDLELFNNKKYSSKQLEVDLADKKKYLFVYTGLFIAKTLTGYTHYEDILKNEWQEYNEEKMSDVLLVVEKSIGLRHNLGIEQISKDCKNLLLTIEQNRKFNKRNLGMNRGIFNLFAKFIEDGEDEDDEELVGFLQNQKEFENNTIGGKMQWQDIVEGLIKETTLLQDDQLMACLQQQLLQLTRYTNLNIHFIHFTHNIYMATQIMLVNSNRISMIWPTIHFILTLNFQKSPPQSIIRKPESKLEHVLLQHLQKLPPIQKSRLRLIQLFFTHLLFQLQLSFLHLHPTLPHYDISFKTGIEYLQGQSLPILVDLLQNFHSYLTLTDQNYNVQALFYIYYKKYIRPLIIFKAYEFLNEVFQNLKLRILDKNDAIFICNITCEIIDVLLVDDICELEVIMVNLYQLYIKIIDLSSNM